MGQSQSQTGKDNLKLFVLGKFDQDGKNAEFMYDHGWYSIIDIKGEERSPIYKSRNAQEAYMKWNVYIGRKKERPVRPQQEEQKPETAEAVTANETEEKRKPKNKQEFRKNEHTKGESHKADNHSRGKEHSNNHKNYNRNRRNMRRFDREDME